ncbi:MAG TPA: hypothetical protein VMB02_14715 [Candidatus Aquilonibacter sp.]|nr:hypothetical protein [Candidatus Aquilonibacter sp.]
MASANFAGAPAPAASCEKGIWFGSHRFSEPEIVPCAVPASNAGIYAILIPDPTCYPRRLRAIYFGESGNVSADLTPWHEKYPVWCEVAGGAINLYVAFLLMESSSPDERAAILSNLVAQYQPECNALKRLL